MKLVVIFSLTCLAFVLNTEGFGISGPEAVKALDIRSGNLGFAEPFLEIGCQFSPFKCNDYILALTGNKAKSEKGKDKDAKDKNDKGKDDKEEDDKPAAEGEEAADGDAEEAADE